MNLQNKVEYERCKEKGLLGRLDILILKEFGTEEEIKAREPKTAQPKLPKPEEDGLEAKETAPIKPKPKKKGKKK